MNPTYTIGTLSGLTGLSPHTIRAWERRYDALSPSRTDSNRRVYHDEDVERLSLLKQVVEAGHSIGQVANLPTDQLRSLESARKPLVQSLATELLVSDPAPYLLACRAALSKMDPEGLEEGLIRGQAALGVLGLLDTIVIPLIHEIETRWLEGSLSVSHEHMASAVLRTYLDQVRRSMPGASTSPRLLVTTPSHQQHEIGALMVAIVAATQAWSVTYLGPNLPAEDIAHAAHQISARAVALSLVYPTDDQALPGQLVMLREKLRADIPILVGGRATDFYKESLTAVTAHILPDLWSAREVLQSLAQGIQ